MSRVGLLTGANSGIGYASAFALADAGMKLGIVCRSVEKAEKVIAEVQRETGNKELIPFAADFSELQQVETLAKDVQSRLPDLNLLVNNAGCYRHQRELSEDGHELVLAVNHFAPFLLTRLLLPLLANHAPSRIVNVASDAHYRGTINFSDLDWAETKYHWFKVYAQSKLANVLTTRELHRRLQAAGKAGVQVFAMHPGVVNTNLFRNPHPIDFLARFAKLFFLNPKKSAEAITQLATSPKFNDASGGYFDLDRPKKPSREARNDDVARRLWDVTEQRLGLTSKLF